MPKRQNDDEPSRDKRKREAHAPVLSGALGGQLMSHAFERCRHFFIYLSALKRIELVSNAANPGAPITAISGLAVKATDQIDDGFRVETDEYSDFADDDEDVVLLPTTAFKRIDAAHFCNLGIKPTFAPLLDLTNKTIADLFHLLKTVAGNTRWLPQRVNIGPDRRIDILHGKLAQEFLEDGLPVCGRVRIGAYVERATESLTEYAADCVKKKKRGVARCARCYIEAYEKDGFADSVFSSQYGDLAGWCCATKNGPLLEALIATS